MFSVWISVFSVDNNLHIIACDVGQGDAILIQKNTTQILIDGGPDNKVIDCLGKHMPFWDRNIELVILTHPQLDHYGGLIDVFKNYKVKLIGEYNRDSSNLSYQVLRKELGSSILLTKGVKLRAGMIYLDIVYPLGYMNDKNVNNDGVVTLLKYGQFKALFTADVENEVSDRLSQLTETGMVNYLKVNHHGSKNGLSEKLLNKIKPEIAVISLGAKNSYGHPHKVILDLLKKYKVKVLRTDEMGDIDIKTDGVKFWYN